MANVFRNRQGRRAGPTRIVPKSQIRKRSSFFRLPIWREMSTTEVGVDFDLSDFNAVDFN